MELKGFITGSLVTLGAIGLLSALKEADVFDDIESFCFDDDDDTTDDSDNDNADGTSEDAEASDSAESEIEKIAKEAQRLQEKLDSLKAGAEEKKDEAVQAAVQADIDNLKKSLADVSESLKAVKEKIDEA